VLNAANCNSDPNEIEKKFEGMDDGNGLSIA